MEYQKVAYWVQYSLIFFLCDLFLVIPNCDLISYADDNTPFAMDISELALINEIKSAAETLSFWF